VDQEELGMVFSNKEDEITSAAQLKKKFDHLMKNGAISHVSAA